MSGWDAFGARMSAALSFVIRRLGGLLNLRSFMPVVAFAFSMAVSVGLASAQPATPKLPDPPKVEVGDRVPPLFRDAVYFKAGADYLRALPEGTKVSVQLADGGSFDLLLEQNRLKTQLNSSQLSDDGQVVISPLGYRVFADPEWVGPLIIEAPNGEQTVFSPQPRGFLVTERGDDTWLVRRLALALRLSDGTRLDFLADGTWEMLTLGGERFRINASQDPANWETLPTIPSPPLIPDIDAAYVAGDGNHWRLPMHEDPIVFAWNWVRFGLGIDQLIEDIQLGQRRVDLRVFFNGIETLQPPAELAGYLLARRLCLTGGERIVFEKPGESPQTVFVLPGPIEPEYLLPERWHPVFLQTPTFSPPTN